MLMESWTVAHLGSAFKGTTTPLNAIFPQLKSTAPLNLLVQYFWCLGLVCFLRRGTSSYVANLGPNLKKKQLPQLPLINSPAYPTVTTAKDSRNQFKISEKFLNLNPILVLRFDNIEKHQYGSCSISQNPKNTRGEVLRTPRSALCI